MNWTPSYHAVSVVRRADPGNKGPTTVSIRHPTDPCLFDASTPPVRMMSEYLLRLVELSESNQIPNIGFRFVDDDQVADETLDFLDVATQRDSWCTSYVFARDLREGDRSATPNERVLVLLAALRHGDCVDAHSESKSAEHDVSYLDRRGIRVIAQLDEADARVRITSMSAYLVSQRKVKLQSTAGLHDNCAVEHGVHCDEPMGNGIHYAREPASSLPTGEDGVVRTLAERRPSRTSQVLNQYLKPQSVAVDCKRLQCEEDDFDYLRIHRSPFVQEDVDYVYREHGCAGGKGVAAYSWDALTGSSSVRTETLARLKAYCNTNQLFEYLVHFGIHPERYFASAELPLAVHYRSGMPYGPGKNGQTVNASVQPGEWKRHQIAPTFCQSPPKLNIHYALADVSRRDPENMTSPGKVPAIPLSIANDPRWVWHEIGHVLLMATTGELEMRFSHSIGDALAAITGDPTSAFVPGMPKESLEKRLHDKGCDDVDKRNQRWRGATFPWVFLPRRHDRCVAQGWSWTGAMHRPILELPDAKQPRRKGYRSEQILSTSLFRLYLCLGGATEGQDGKAQRLAASEYALYLIIKGLGLLGDARLVPANHPDQLVSALIDADAGTRTFSTSEGGMWAGGIAHKAIRWAFEAQGLYGTSGEHGLGKPPAVDIFIADRRPHHEEWGEGKVNHGPGSYVPVPLSLPNCDKAVPSAQPLWLASEKAITVTPQGISVQVGNRGSALASDVEVSVYYAPCDGSELPGWPLGEDSVWLAAEWQGGGTANKPDLGAGTTTVFETFAWVPKAGVTYLILAQASCPADRANTDHASGLPCSVDSGPLPLLVANDNNLGLIVWRQPPDE